MFLVIIFSASLFFLKSYVDKYNNSTPKSQPVATPTQTQVKGVSEGFYPVVHVVDGDTLDVEIDGKKERIRLIGIDTPEVVDPRKPVQCFGREASNKAKEILTDRLVKLEGDPTQSDRDKYGRLLRYIYLEDGTFFNKFMIVEGFAHEYTYHSNPYKYQEEFIQAERQAREQNKGLWSPATCSGSTR